MNHFVDHRSNEYMQLESTQRKKSIKLDHKLYYIYIRYFLRFQFNAVRFLLCWSTFENIFLRVIAANQPHLVIYLNIVSCTPICTLERSKYLRFYRIQSATIRETAASSLRTAIFSITFELFSPCIATWARANTC